MGICIGKDTTACSVRRVHPDSPKNCEYSSILIQPNYSKIPNKFKTMRHPRQSIGGLVGLQNLGNTCYINSAIQCLSHTQPLTDYFNSGLHKIEMNATNPLSSNGQITESYAQLLNQLWCPSNKSINSRQFLITLSRWNPRFCHYTQEDSHEFLAYLLDMLHEDLNRVKLKPYIEEKTFQQQPTSMQGLEAWQNYLKRNRSVIVDLFQGQIKNCLRCLECQVESHKFEPFMYLSLPIPESQTIKLEDCIANYQKEELLDSKNSWKCSNCKEFRKSIKSMILWKLPNILVIHLKRFKYTSTYRCKIRTQVQYPLIDLNLENYVSQQQPSTYDLYSVINHSGTLSRGHYTSFCKSKDNQNWYKFDDSQVKEVKEKQIINNQDAYLLFYHKNSVDDFERQTERLKSSVFMSNIYGDLSKQPSRKKLLKSCIHIVTEQQMVTPKIMGKRKSSKQVKLTPLIESNLKSTGKFHFFGTEINESVILKQD